MDAVRKGIAKVHATVVNSATALTCTDPTSCLSKYAPHLSNELPSR